MSQAEPPAAAPPTLPPAGYYPDPNGQSRWWDGTKWTTALQPVPVPPPRYPPAGYPPSIAPAGNAGSANTLVQQVETFVGDHKSGLTMLAGGVLAADGLVGLPRIGRRRANGLGSMVSGLICGVIMVIIGIAIHISVSHANSTQTAIVNGSIVSMSREASSSGTTCAPVVSYAVGGQQYTVRSNYSDSGQCGDQIGQPLEVAYNPLSPAQAHLPSAAGASNSLAWILMGVGLLLAIGCLFGVVLRGGEVAGGAALLVHGWRKRKS